MIKYWKKVFKPDFVRNIIFTFLLFILLMVIIDCTNSTLVATIKKNYVFQITKEGDSSILAVHKRLNGLYENQILINNRLLTFENKQKRR